MSYFHYFCFVEFVLGIPIRIKKNYGYESQNKGVLIFTALGMELWLICLPKSWM